MNKRCKNGKQCKTSPNEPIPIERFGLHATGNVKAICNRCHNGAVSKIDTFSHLQHFMASTKWGKAEQVKINDYTSQLRLSV